jgi:hypothetical protein
VAAHVAGTKNTVTHVFPTEARGGTQKKRKKEVHFLAQGKNATTAVGLEPRTSQFVQSSNFKLQTFINPLTLFRAWRITETLIQNIKNSKSSTLNLT